MKRRALLKLIGVVVPLAIIGLAVPVRVTACGKWKIEHIRDGKVLRTDEFESTIITDEGQTMTLMFAKPIADVYTTPSK